MKKKKNKKLWKPKAKPVVIKHSRHHNQYFALCPVCHSVIHATHFDTTGLKIPSYCEDCGQPIAPREGVN